MKFLAPPCLGSIALLACSPLASAALIPLGYLSYDVTVPGLSSQFDITNQTGANSTPFPDSTWPVANPVSFAITSLTVDFSDGSTTVFGPSYFTLEPDGLSLFGNSLDISGSNPQPTEAILSGTIDNSTLRLNDGSKWTVTSPPTLVNLTGSGNPVLMDSTGICGSGPSLGCLQDGDLDIISVAAQPVPVPEPALSPWLALMCCLLCLTIRRSQRKRSA